MQTYQGKDRRSGQKGHIVSTQKMVSMHMVIGSVVSALLLSIGGSIGTNIITSSFENAVTKPIERVAIAQERAVSERIRLESEVTELKKSLAVHEAADSALAEYLTKQVENCEKEIDDCKSKHIGWLNK